MTLHTFAAPQQLGQWVMTSLRTVSAHDLPTIRQRCRHTQVWHVRSRVLPRDLGCLAIGAAWRGLCASIGMVVSRSGKLAAFALIVAIAGATSSTLVAECARPEACPMQHQECHHTSRITECCRGHLGDASHQGGPVEARVQLTVDLSSLPLGLAAGACADVAGTSARIDTSPPSNSCRDLSARFAPLLI
jgi:hypothetical protein